MESRLHRINHQKHRAVASELSGKLHELMAANEKLRMRLAVAEEVRTHIRRIFGPLDLWSTYALVVNFSIC